jgi:DNA-binding IscR family transcriptional regulator
LKVVLYISKNNEDLYKIYDLSQKLNISESLLRRIISDLEKSMIIKTIK